MVKRHQVFVSSTFLDLQSERQAVLHALLEIGCIPVGMELFPAASESQWSYITRTILECDYYIVIVGGKYGSLAPDGLSYTEKEYRFAVENGKPVIAFLHPDPTILAKTESDATRIAKFNAFREHCESMLCKRWTSGEALAAAVTTSITQLIEDRPSFGWIHGERYKVLERSHREALDYIRRLSLLYQVSFRYRDRIIKHQVFSNGKGILDEEFTIVPEDSPVSIYLTRYGFNSLAAAPCNPRVSAWDASDGSPLSVCAIEQNELSVLFAILLDRPSTTHSPVRLRLRCERDHIWSELISDRMADNHLVLDQPCNALELRYEAPPGKRWLSLRGMPLIGHIETTNEGTTILWKISELNPTKLGYRITLNDR